MSVEIEIIIRESEPGFWHWKAHRDGSAEDLTEGPFASRVECEEAVSQWFGFRTPAKVIVYLGEDLDGKAEGKMAHLR